MKIEKNIYEFARKNNILAGICSIERFDYIKDILVEKNLPFTETNIEKRINPLETMQNAKSIIVIGVNYNKSFKIPSDNNIRGKISISAVGKDYHYIVKEKLEELKNYIIRYTDFKYKIFVDTGPLVDRELAKRSGIGWQGKNCSIISENFGSFFSIGYMLTNLELKCSIGYEYKYSKCKDCNKCINACPNKALSYNGFDYKKCISYLTQSKDRIDFNTMKSMGNNIYGCDICQLVCPYNKDKPNELFNDVEQIMPSIENIINMSNKEYEKRFKNTSAGWRGKKILQRNCIISLGNSKNENSLKMIKNLIYDEREEIIYAVIGALRNLNHIDSISILKEIEAISKNKELKNAIKETIIYLINNTKR